MDGIILVNKDSDMTSRDVVNELTYTFHTKKIGHTGTLDPLATGVLVICIGKALKVAEYITALEKEYIAEITMGINTDTLDITGKVLEEKDVNIRENDIDKVLSTFIGEYDMEVPIYSAVKVNGKRLYEYARNNIEVELPIHKVNIYSLERISNVEKNKFMIKCSVSIEDSYTLDEIKNGEYKLIPVIDYIDLPKVEVDESLLKKIKNGAKLENNFGYDKFCFVYDNEVIAIYQSNGLLVKPVKVLNNN